MGSFARTMMAWTAAIIVFSIGAAFFVAPSISIGMIFEGMMGIGLIVGVPMLPFVAILGFSLSLCLKKIRPIWLSSIFASVISSAAGWLLTTLIFPHGWEGAAQAYVVFAALFGMIWGLIDYARSGMHDHTNYFDEPLAK